jgi:DNA-binding SARP family transcriptional activator
LFGACSVLGLWLSGSWGRLVKFPLDSLKQEEYFYDVTTVTLSVLGPIECRVNGALANPGGRRQRALLAMLATDIGRVVPVDRIVELLWSGEPPDQAVATLQTYVANLRRAIEPDRAPREPASILVTQPPGYALHVDADAVDAMRFQRSAEHARGLVASDPNCALALLTEALSWWRGEAYAEFADESFAMREANRLNELRLLAIEDRFDALLRVGAHREAAAELEHFANQHPTRERVQAMLALTLYRSSRQGDALRVIDATRVRLRDELGLDAGPELVALERDILNHSPRLQPQNDAVPTLRQEALEWTTTSATSPTLTAERVGAPSEHMRTHFVGRVEERARINAMLDDLHRGKGGVLLLVGEPGEGKSWLAEYVAAQQARYGGHVTWTRCQQGAAHPFGVSRSVATQLSRLLSDEPAAALDEFARALSDALPQLATETPKADGSLSAAEQRILAMIDGLLELKWENQKQQTFVVIVDDLQWADAASLLALSAGLGPGLMKRENGVLLVLTLRSTEEANSIEVVNALGRLSRSGAARIDVKPLSIGDVAELLDTTDEGLAKLVHERTGGNAFFVGQMIELLRSESSLTVDDLERAVPKNVVEVVRRRLSKLPDETQEFLTIAATAGSAFDLTIVGDVNGLSVSQALDVISPAIQAGIVVDDERLPGLMRFAHAITADAIAEKVPSLRRAVYHGRIGDAIFARFGYQRNHLGEITLHYDRAVPAGYGPAAARALLASALDAGLRRFARESHDYLDRCETILHELPPDHERVSLDVDLRLCRAQLIGWTGRWGDPQIGPLLDRVRTASIEHGLKRALWAGTWLSSTLRCSAHDFAGSHTNAQELVAWADAEADSPDASIIRALSLDATAMLAITRGDAAVALAARAKFPLGKFWVSEPSQVIEALVYLTIERRALAYQAMAAWMAGDPNAGSDFVKTVAELMERRSPSAIGMLGSAMFFVLVDDEDDHLRTTLLAAFGNERPGDRDVLHVSRIFLNAKATEATADDLDRLRSAYRSVGMTQLQVMGSVFTTAAARELIRFGFATEAIGYLEDDLREIEVNGGGVWKSELQRMCALAYVALGKRDLAHQWAHDAVQTAEQTHAPRLLERARRTFEVDAR